MNMRSGRVMWLFAGALALCGSPAWAADLAGSNATLAELRLWFAAIAIAALLVGGVFRQRGQFLFALLLLLRCVRC